MKQVILFSCASFLLLVSACGESAVQKGRTDGGACTDQCPETGETKCVEGGVQTCGDFNSDGCNEWNEPLPCDEGKTCMNGVCSAPCDDECAPSGAADCEGGAAVKTCGSFDDDACLEWSEPAPCAEGETCSNGTCGTGCLDECTEDGAVACENDAVKTCGSFDEDSCLDWSEPVPCAEGESCSNGICRTGCRDECTVSDARECSGAGFRVCGNLDQDECLEWSDVTPCTVGETCSNGRCAEGCVDECNTQGLKECAGDAIKTCDYWDDDDDCLEWGTPVNCAEGETCSNGVCQEECVHECTEENVKRCAGNMLQTCVDPDFDGCLEWGTPVNCPEGETCSNGQCSSVCSDECDTVGAKRCSGNDVEQCGGFDEDDCLEWSVVENCGETKTCSNGECMLSCEDECSPAGALQCSGNAVQSCGNFDLDSCLEWSTAAACGEEETCSNGVCSALCENECTSAGALRCSGDAVQRCGNFDLDPCLEWSTPSNCLENETCSNGVCSAKCTDECNPAGSLQCSGGGFQSCGNSDEDSCLEWSNVTPCAEGETCSGGVCAASCIDECTKAGALQCSGNGYQSCGNFDLDQCLEWSNVTNCSAGETCSNGICSSVCFDECFDAGEKKCAAEGYRQCGNYDTDSCIEWSSVVNCPQGETCSNGACAVQCENECPAEGDAQCEPGGVETCGNYDNDNCLEWGTPVQCAEGEMCQDGQCVPGCLNECDTPDETACSGNSVMTCGDYDEDACFEWGGESACNGDEVCGGGECVPCPADDLEPNDSFDAARTVSAGTYEDLWVCYGDEDWFAVQLSAGYTVDIKISFSHAQGDLDLYLYDADGNYLDSSASITDSEEVFHTAQVSGTYYIFVYGWSGSTGTYDMTIAAGQCEMECLTEGTSVCSGNGYETCGQFDADICLDWSQLTPCAASENCIGGECVPCEDECSSNGAKSCDGHAVRTCGEYDEDSCLDLSDPVNCQSSEICFGGECVACAADQFEENDTLDTASAVGPGTYADLTLCYLDDDWYSVGLAAGQTLLAQIDFSNAEGDLDLYLSDADGNWLDLSASTRDTEKILYTAQDAGTYFILVAGYYDATGEYSLTVGKGACQNECDSDGGTECEDNGVKTCGNHDNDICLEWGEIVQCADNEECFWGQCWPCSDECADGDITCYQNAVWTCGQADSDSCLDWVMSDECEADELCVENTCVNCEPDHFEPNEDAASARGVSAGTYGDIGICYNDQDYFNIALDSGETITVTVTFSSASGDIDLYFLDPSEQMVAVSWYGQDVEEITYEADQSGNWYIVVNGWSGATGDYAMTVNVQ